MVAVARQVAQKASGSLIRVDPTSGALGAEVRDVDLAAFDDWAFASFMRALLKHQVLLVRGQTLSDRERAVLGRRFGRATLTYTPYGATSGGSSTFCSLYAAYDALPPRLRSRIAHFKIRHIMSSDVSLGSGAAREPIKAVVQPLVTFHPDTGRAMLVLGARSQASLVGLELAESDALLDELWAFATRAQFSWTHVRRQGDLLVWDALSTLHLAGPVLPPAAASRPSLGPDGTDVIPGSPTAKHAALRSPP